MHNPRVYSIAAAATRAKRRWRTILTVLGAGLGLAFAEGRAVPVDSAILAGPVAVEMVRVIDGDSIAVRARIWIGTVMDIQVRLDGIDAPELDGRCRAERELAEKARSFLAERLAGGTVSLLRIRNDKYGGRFLARVITSEGDDVGVALVAAGLARTYGGERRAGWCGQTSSEQDEAVGSPTAAGGPGGGRRNAE